MDTAGERERSRTPYLLLGIVLGIWGLSWALLATFVDKPEDRGLFGDMFGAVNALFSGLALAGVVYAIFLQRQELQLQREELELTRAELRRSAEAQENSEKALVSQAKALADTARANTMTLMPTTMCSFTVMHISNGGLYPILNIANVGNVPAFDFEIYIACVFSSKKEHLAQLRKYIRPGFVSDFDKVRFTEDGFYGIRDQVHYPMVPPRRQRSLSVVSTDLPIWPVGIHTLVQFRDVQGHNYSQVYYFEHTLQDETHVFRLVELNPPTPLAHSRIHVESSDNGVQLRNGESALEFASHFQEILQSSISCVCLNSSIVGGEDWGDWQEI
ncbi:hypothetical protein [Sorangium sp. So ce131]|uniref:hypothetical protein n=1 Tax=Sorangium sp. So ce131 TaxID=3133282 RepID=UPI003F62EB3F